MMYFAEFVDTYGEVYTVQQEFCDSEETTIKLLIDALSARVDEILAAEKVSFYIAKPLKVTVRYEVAMHE